MNPVKALQSHGQAIWLDFLARSFTEKGALKQLIDDDGIRGVTSNPAIFEKAIGGTDEYDSALAVLLEAGDRTVTDLYEALAIEDIQKAADVLRPVYDETGGADGFVSLEVAPYLAYDTAGTIDEAERLWHEVDRKNLMIKVPATPEGLVAIEHLISKGISVNITLLFSQDMYRQVAEAYIAGLETYIGKGGEAANVASVASFFISRIDAAVDAELDSKIASTTNADDKQKLTSLKGKVAIANARLAYQDYKQIFAGERWQTIAAKGARPQRLLWASTGTKNKDYRDVLYIEELIGDNTVNTVPPATLDAFRDHGVPRTSVEENIDEAQHVLASLAAAGVSLDDITGTLLRDGVDLFIDAADKLLGALARKRLSLLGDAAGPQQISLTPELTKSLAQETEDWRKSGKVRRLWQHDKSVWSNTDEDRWLGWLDATSEEIREIADYETFAEWVGSENFSDVVVLGMGGSSLGPDVLADIFPHQKNFPELHVLDSTDPGQIRALESTIDLARTLFVVSSKSGGTIEPNRLRDYFFARVGAIIGQDLAGSHFVAITDPGSPMEHQAQTQGFAHIFHGDPNIGGRYSVLSPFGLVPLATIGVDIGRFLEFTRIMVRSCASDVPPAENPAVQLGLAMALAGRTGRDKVTFFCSQSIAGFGPWAEQLIAESTGKNGGGLIPIDGEPPGAIAAYGADRLFIDMRTKDEADTAHEAFLVKLEQAGHPVIRIILQSADHIGQEFFRFEFATAVAGAAMQLNPFDQPDVEAAKVKSRELTAEFDKSGAMPDETSIATGTEFAIFADAENASALKAAGADRDLASWLRAQLSRIKTGDYVALLAYVARNDANSYLLQAMRTAIRDKKQIATSVGFGPRFLHSTGQIYKGGPNTGVFFQITADDAPDLPIPGQAASFGIIKAAQARGDFDVLCERKRRAIRIHLKGDVTAALGTLASAFNDALSPRN